MTLRSDVLVLDSRAYTAGQVSDLATVPADQRWLLKDISVRNATGTASGVRLSLVRSAVGYPFLEVTVAGGSTTVSAERFVVLDAGDILRATVAAATTIVLNVAGARFELTP